MFTVLLKVLPFLCIVVKCKTVFIFSQTQRDITHAAHPFCTNFVLFSVTSGKSSSCTSLRLMSSLFKTNYIRYRWFIFFNSTGLIFDLFWTALFSINVLETRLLDISRRKSFIVIFVFVVCL